MTLHSGSSLAATSAATCLVRQLTAVTPVQTPGDDPYFRYRLWVIRKKRDQVVESYWIKGQDLAAFARNGQMPFLGSTSWQGFAISTNMLAAGGPSVMEPSYRSSRELVQEGPYVVLRVDSQGGIVGAGASGTGSAVSDSCWNSFAIQTL